MTNKDIFVMGRAEYISEHDGISLTAASEIAENEWKEMYGE